MAKINIKRDHQLDSQQCKVLTEGLLQELVAKFGGKFKQSSQGHRYQHPTGIRGSVRDSGEELSINIEFGMMTSYLAPKIKQAVNSALDEQMC